MCEYTICIPPRDKGHFCAIFNVIRVKIAENSLVKLEFRYSLHTQKRRAFTDLIYRAHLLTYGRLQVTTV